MRKILLLLLVGVALAVFAFEKIDALFFEARYGRDPEKILQLIQTLESRSDLNQNSMLLTILADYYLEYGDWSVAKEQKEKTLGQARKHAEAAISLNAQNGKAHYIAGAAIGRLAQYKGIIQSLFMLGDFDKYINRAISLLNENDEKGRLYKTFALIASV